MRPTCGWHDLCPSNRLPFFWKGTPDGPTMTAATNVELTSANFWLAMMALSSLAQLVITITVVVLAWRAYVRAADAVDELERDHLRPLALKAHALIDDLQDMAARARTVDDAVRSRIEDVESALHSTKEIVLGRFWPVFGVIRALRAGAGAWSRRGAATRRVTQGG